MVKAVFPGRFQPFHNGHKSVVEDLKSQYDEVAVLICDEESRTEENPLNFEEREKLIRECFPEIQIETQKNREEDDLWAEELIRKTDPDVIISRSDWTNDAIENSTDIEVKEQQLHEREIYSGTETRRRIRSGEEWRYLVPDETTELIEQLTETFKNSGKQYEFEPGWKKENSFYDTAED